jgi:predicted nuclease of predicted toxin-antitoxin system
MKTVIDMNLSPRWVQVLKDAGFEAAHWSAIGLPTAKFARKTCGRK